MLPHFEPGRPIYAMQASGFDGVAAPYRPIEAMAALYVAELVAAHPEGPYAVAGMSFGGLIAWEMADQLVTVGHEVALVGVLGTKPRSRMTPETCRMIDQLTVGSARKMSPTKRIVTAPYRKLRRFALRAVLAVLVRLGRPLPDAFKLRGNHYWNIHSRAAAVYTASSISPPVRVIAEQGSTAVHQEIWTDLAPGGLSIHEVATSHLELVVEPHVGDTVGGLDRALRGIEDRDTSTA
jgi:acetoacetyl-CoA synthetase